MPPDFDIEHLPPGSRLELYVKPGCPYCAKARAHYDALGQRYSVHDAQNDRGVRAKMLALANGDPTVPAILVDGRYIQSGWGKPRQG